MIRDLIYYNNKLLLQRAEEIEEITPEIRALAQDMIETMHHTSGIGLAAPQIGVLKRIFVVLEHHVDEKGEPHFGEPRIFINPVLSDPSAEKCVHEEGCLSIPKLYVEVERPVEITIRALDLDGKEVEERASGFFARMLMHEADHVNGTLMIHRVSKRDKKRIQKDLDYIDKRYNKK